MHTACGTQPGRSPCRRACPQTVVSAQLRHSRPAFTAARYSHLLGDHELDRLAAAHTTGTVGELGSTTENRLA